MKKVIITPLVIFCILTYVVIWTGKNFTAFEEGAIAYEREASLHFDELSKAQPNLVAKYTHATQQGRQARKELKFYRNLFYIFTLFAIWSVVYLSMKLLLVIANSKLRRDLASAT